jgi:hypothetical protein
VIRSTPLIALLATLLVGCGAAHASAPVLRAEGEVLRWSPVAGATGYRVEACPAGCSRPGSFTTTSKPWLQPEALPPAVVEYRVQALTPVPGEWSSARTVTYPPRCTRTLRPGASIEAVLNRARPGNVICLSAGAYTAPAWREHGGTATAPVTLRSKDANHPATLYGRFVTEGSATHIAVQQLRFVWSGKGNPRNLDDTVVLGTAYEDFVHNDVNGVDAHICLNGVEYPRGSGTKVERSIIDHNTIHDCGNPAIEDQRLHAQGIYMLGGPGDYITNNWCWKVAARCYQVRGERGTAAYPSVWAHNVSDESREGWVFGNGTASYNVVEHNVVGSVEKYSAFTLGLEGAGDVFAQNCISKAFAGGEGMSVSKNLVTAVSFKSPQLHDYKVTAPSGCIANGAWPSAPGVGHAAQ